MSKKTTTDTKQQTQFNPASMASFNALQPGIQGVLQQYMQDPLTSSFFNQRQGMAQRYIAALLGRNMRNIYSNAGQFAGGMNPGFQNSQLLRAGRQGSSMQANAFMQNLFGSEQNRLQATGLAQGYNPLVTGQNSQSTQTVSGLGTWLPQVLGAGLSFAMPFIPGLKGLFPGGGGGAGASGPSSGPGG